MPAFTDLTGQRFGRLVVVSQAETKNQQVRWNCVCDCGEPKITRGHTLRHGKCRSCGCLLSTNRRKHGGTSRRLYRVWSAMRGRCSNPKNMGYHNYGGRGISVCDEWQEYKAFEDWADAHGYASDLEIDRIDVDGNYEPENCRFVTRKENARNLRTTVWTTYRGNRVSLSDLAEITGIHNQTLRRRIVKLGWSGDKAADTPRDTWATRRSSS